MNPDNYICVAEKLVDAVLQMEQIIDRLLTAHDKATTGLSRKSTT